jgi:hypothetical protein
MSPKKLLLLIALGIALFISFALALYMMTASETIQFNWLVASFLISFSTSFLLLFFVNI